ncbi:hypothetical protein K2173_004381 [Erythroxylum novogranatense]|uniref:Ribosomal protein L32 n=1 Tax=Erythroxylum novogranatense TaxID=1862640 RepID=A0AAV8T4B2_9ROSI|nr:hypothetical protein K2173_004381 [Erythroxylum novogranatense]
MGRRSYKIAGKKRKTSIELAPSKKSKLVEAITIRFHEFAVFGNMWWRVE